MSDGMAPCHVAAAGGPWRVFGYSPPMQLDWSDLRGAVAAGCLLISSVPAAAQVAAPPQQGAPQPAPPPPSVAAVSAPSDRFAIPATDDGLPGTGPIRRMEWFQNLWKQRRTVWSTQVQRDQGAVVFLGDSITQGWGDGLGAVFPGVKVANRGISGDTTRGVLIRLKEDVLDLNPRAVVMLIGTNDLEEKATPETIDSDFRLLIATLKAHNPKMPIIACLVIPSSVTMRRPAEEIKKINALRMASIKGDPQVIPLDTWTLFADKTGEPIKDEFPDLLHPNDYGYIKFAAALRPIFATLGFTETEPDYFTPEPGFESLFNGKDLTGWGLRPTTEADKESAKKLAGLRPERGGVADRHRDGVRSTARRRAPTAASRPSTAGSSSPRRPSRDASSRSGRSASSRRTSCSSSNSAPRRTPTAASSCAGRSCSAATTRSPARSRT